MNRRGFFSFLPAAAVGVAMTPAEAKTNPNEDKDFVWSGKGAKCECGCGVFHFVQSVFTAPVYPGIAAYSLAQVGQPMPVCVWCGSLWTAQVRA